MIFDLFHSISDPRAGGTQIGPPKVLEQFLSQVRLAESLQFDTVWLAESHFSSEVQKQTRVATISNFFGEVGLNADSFQFFHWLQEKTKRIHLGTAIHNIVGGSGGPIASADRVNMLRAFNECCWENSRVLRLGVASGRFPYQNTPFGILPRNRVEEDFWPIVKRVIFLEALEIFLRLVKGEVLSSANLREHQITEDEVARVFPRDCQKLKSLYSFPLLIKPRWEFEPLQIVPTGGDLSLLRVVLGSSDPEALELGLSFWDLDLFNLSFTPPEQIEGLHRKMSGYAAEYGRVWNRSRLPRTVLVFIDPNPKRAMERAHFCLDTYIEAMRGTAAVPDKSVLLERALVGDASMVRDQLDPANPRRFNNEDRLMLWFEFNQLDAQSIESQMKYFHSEVIEKL